MKNISTDVTVVVIGYKHAAYVAQCLDSIATQTVPVKCILIDDASGDETRSVVEAWCEVHPDLTVTRIYHAQNRGLVRTLNEAVKGLSTTYFAYIAADDWMQPDRTELQLAAFAKAGPQCALVYSDVYRADHAGARFDQTYAQLHSDQWEAASDPDAYTRLLAGNWIPAPSVMLRKSAVEQVGGYDEEIFFEDHDMYLRLAEHHQLVCVAEPLATHRELDDSYGHRMFFTDEGRRDFQKAQVSLLIKHAAAPQAVPAGVQDKLRARISQLYWAGESPAWIHRQTKQLIQALKKPDPMLRLIGFASGLGVSGRIPGKIRSYLVARRGM